MSITADQIGSLSDSSSVYNGSNKIGKVGQVYLDDQTGEPSWVTVKTGLFGSAETFVPLTSAQLDGDDVRVDYDEDTIKGAPRVDADGNLSPQEEEELYRYYGLDDGTAGQQTGSDHGVVDQPTDEAQHADTVEAAQQREDHSDEAGVVGHDTSGPTTDEAMTRSEEQLNVGTASRESGRARLRKYVTTEQVTETVPVRHEEVTLEREPITEANQEAAGSGPQISEEEHEVTLHEEVPVVDKDVVAVERVKLGKETVTEDATVTEDVRSENIELIDPDETSGRATDQTVNDQR